MKRFIAHMKGLSFTNRMALYLIIILAVGLLGGFILAMRSIECQYTGPLTCWTVVFTPIGTACSIVLAFIVNKSKAENTSATGEGIKYALAMREAFRVEASVNNAPAESAEDSAEVSPTI